MHQGATFTPSRRDNAAPLAPPIGRSVDTNAIREWARVNGHEVPGRGRVPAALRDAWERATQGQ
ncbi:histone-like nucleoid-structuring protein Lsr2 [Streptomyces canus]|uniref:Lsr2 family DNA-binding protein n=1 Tax=Streptomyces canus TaxID=58343 RepID=UPI0038658DAE